MHLPLLGAGGKDEGELVGRGGQGLGANAVPLAVGTKVLPCAVAYGGACGLVAEFGATAFERAVQGDIVGTEGGHIPIGVGRWRRAGRKPDGGEGGEEEGEAFQHCCWAHVARICKGCAKDDYELGR